MKAIPLWPSLKRPVGRFVSKVREANSVTAFDKLHKLFEARASENITQRLGYHHGNYLNSELSIR